MLWLLRLITGHEAWIWFEQSESFTLFNFRQRHLLDPILWIWHWPFKMIIRAKHTCESDLRAFCTKMHLKHLLHKQPTPKSYSYIILKFPPIPTLYSACLETLFWLFWGNMFCKSAPSWQTCPHAGLGHPHTIFHVSGPPNKILCFPYL